VFTIQKKSGKWRLLQDLRALNAVMQDMGPLQPKLPSPAMIPEQWDILIPDLKDCFFTIPLHPDDCEKFAFTVPAVNRASPTKQYQWVVLPQGMKNSPAMCQWYVDLALQPFRRSHQELIFYHYMDDLLLASRCPIQDDIVFELKGMLEDWGLVVAPEKIQRQPPWKYLGMTLSETVIRPQKLTIRADNVKTLNDVQKLVGDLQWIRNVGGITNTDLQPLYELLQDGKDPYEPRQLTQPAEAALQIIAQKISHGSISWILEGSPIQLYIYDSQEEIIGILAQ